MSLKVRIAGVIFLLVAMLVAIGLAPLVLQQVTGNQREQVLQRDTIVMLLRDVAGMELQAGGLDELQGYLKHVVHNPRVAHVLVASRDGHIVADSDGLHLGRRLPLPYGAPTLRWVTAPIRHNGSRIGTLAIAFQRTPGDLYRRRISWIALVVALGATVLIAGTSLLLAGLLTRRTNWVVQALRQFGERTAQGTVPPAGAAGQDDLARAFAEMAARVAAEHERLEEANRLLEQTVGELRAAEQAWERSERDYHLLLQHAHDGVVVTGADLRITDANPSFCRLLGYTREELVGRTYGTLLPPGEEQRQPLSYFRMPSGGSLLFDRRLQRRDGTVLTLEASCTRVEDGCAIGILRDVTERTATLGALAESEARYREIVETTHEGVWVIDGDLRTTFVNQRMAEMLGYSPEEMLGRSSLDFMAPKELSSANQAVARSRAGQSEQSEWTLVRRDGEHIVVLANLTPRVDADGRHLGALGLFADITERKQAEAELARREREYRLLLENAYDAILLVDRTNHIIETNPRTCELLGYTREELLGLDYARLVDPADLERVPLQFGRSFAGGSVVLERRFVRKDGTLVEAELSSTGIDERRVQNVIRDVTERKAAEAALRESEELSRTLLGAAFDGIVIHDNGTILETNPAYERMFGYSKAELVGQSLVELVIAPETRAAMQARERNDERQFTEGMGLHKDGRRIYFEAVGRTHTYQGRRVRIVAVRDITERKQAEAALRESEELSRTLLSAAFDGIVIHDNGRILETNPAYERMYGYSKAELLGLNLLEELIAPESREILAWAIADADPYPIEGIGVRKDGRRIHFEAVGMTHWHQGRRVRVAAVRDITERKEAEAALRERERRLREAHRIAHLGEWMWDIDADAFAMSDQLAEILGLAPGSHTRDEMMAVVHPADHDRMAAAIADALDGGDALADFDFRVQCPDSTVRDLHARAHLVRDEAGRPVRLLGTTQDITERKAADAALRERETRLREAQAIAGLGDWEWDPETDEFNGSDELYRILGIPVDGSVR
ncbi:MAG TPA: PAS domain S-box protein, partial [bacterium]|nr:PAS domain S-box protein [bacterium]